MIDLRPRLRTVVQSEVQSGLTTAGNHVVHTQSIGYLKERGLYITIRTPQGQHTALQIARSLHGAGK